MSSSHEVKSRWKLNKSLLTHEIQFAMVWLGFFRTETHVTTASYNKGAQQSYRQYHMKVLLNSFSLIGHKLGLHQYSQK